MGKSKSLEDWLLPYQRQFANAKSRKKIWCSGRQVGKSFTLAYMAVRQAASVPGATVLVISTGERASNEFLRKCSKFVEALNVLTDGSYFTRTTQDMIELSNGSRILSLPSGNPRALRGYSAQLTIVDEAAYIEHAEEVLAAIAPTLTRDPKSQLVLASTPAGTSGMFYEIWMNDDSFYKLETDIEKAVGQGLKVDLEEIRRMCIDPAVYDVEYMCRFSQSVGKYIEEDAFQFVDKCPFSGGRRVLGVDFGRFNDCTALVEFLQNGEQFYLDNVTLMKNADWQSQFSAIEDLNRKRHIDCGYMDANGIGSAIAEQVQKRVNHRIKPYTTTSSNKTPMYESFKGLVYDKRLFVNIAFKDLLLDDVANTRKIITNTGKISYQASRNGQGHSDIVSACVRGIQSAKDTPLNASRPVAWKMKSVFS